MADCSTMLTTHTRIHDLLEATGLFEAGQLEEILQAARANSQPVCATILELSDLKEDELLTRLAESMVLPYQRLKEVEIDPAILEKLPPKAIFLYNVMPLAEEDECLMVATSDPFTPGLADALGLAAECRIRMVL
ncbi:MAG: hypothetical protein KJN67_05560, partial [Pontiella sp.]|nr:hypothetical protein [Pontiella sp.]